LTLEDSFVKGTEHFSSALREMLGDGMISASDIARAVPWDAKEMKEDFKLVPAHGEEFSDQTVRYVPTVASGSITLKLVQRIKGSGQYHTKEDPLGCVFTDGAQMYVMEINLLDPLDLEVGKTYVLTATSDTVVYAPKTLVGQILRPNQMRHYLNLPTISIREATPEEAEQMASTLSLNRA
jgi:hypothetical protein